MRIPFRADQVGSLLRPERLKQARERFLGPQTPTRALAPHENEQLREVEDQCIREAVAMQERIGLRAVTDGEFRRRSWWLELILGWEGFAALVRDCPVPVYAIGGLTRADLAEAKRRGAHGVALRSAAFS